MSIEAMKQALELALDALTNSQQHIDQYHPEWVATRSHNRDAIHVCEQAIAEAAKQEPVAWRRPFEGDVSDLCQWLYADEYEPKDDNPNWQAIYDHPQPKREPLTDEQIGDIAALFYPRWQGHEGFARAVEAAHGIKENT